MKITIFGPQTRASLLFSLSIFISQINYSQEGIGSCSDGIDNDADGLIDCYDPDCHSAANCSTSFFGAVASSSCQFSHPGPYTLVDTWSGTENLVLPSATPVAGDIDNDGDVEIVICRGMTPGLTDSILVINGNTGQIESRFSAPFFVGGSKGDVIALGDIDGDSFSEIIVVDLNRRIHCFEHNGVIKWTSSTVLESFASPSISDFNSDGVPEVFAGRQIFNGQTGVQIAIGSGSRGLLGAQMSSVAFDVLPSGYCANCQGKELVAGNQVYSVDISSGTMTIQTTATSSNGDGTTSIVDFDEDGDLDAVVVSEGVVAGTALLWVWDVQTSSTIGSTIQLTGSTSNYAGEATISDFDNDGYVEIGVSCRYEFVVIDDFFSGMGLLWTRSTNDDSGTTGASTFDFDGDGAFEAIVRDQDSLFIYDGSDGSLKGSFPCLSGTITEKPIVIDANNDGHAEICVPCASPTFTSRAATLRLLRPTSNSWLSSRLVWNQSQYHITNVNDDLTIPITVQNHCLWTTTHGFSIQATALDTAGAITYTDLSGVPNLPLATNSTVVVDNIDLSNCNTGPNTIDVTLNVSNLSSDLDLPSGTPITLYNDNPFSTTANSILTTFTTSNLSFGSNELITVTIPDQGGNFSLSVVSNDMGTTTGPFNIPPYSTGECDFSDNHDMIPIVACVSPLPVVLNHFDVKASKKPEVLVTWSTASEINNSKFLVQRSKDGIQWEDIGSVSGAGNSTSELFYDFIDFTPYCSRSFYRISQMDFNGTTEVFSPKAINRNCTSNLIIYPNPNKTGILTLTAPGNNNIRFYSIDGLDITSRVRLLEENRLEKIFDISALTIGVYLIADGPLIEKFIVE